MTAITFLNLSLCPSMRLHNKNNMYMCIRSNYYNDNNDDKKNITVHAIIIVPKERR